MITKPVPALLCAPTSHNPTSRTTPELASALHYTGAALILAGIFSFSENDLELQPEEHEIRPPGGPPNTSGAANSSPEPSSIAEVRTAKGTD
jgi:hypothetical protein